MTNEPTTEVLIPAERAERIAFACRVALTAAAFLALAGWSRGMMRLDGPFAVCFLASGVVVGASLRERGWREFIIVGAALCVCSMLWDLLMRQGSLVSAGFVALTVAAQALAARMAWTIIDRRIGAVRIWLNPARVVVPASIVGAMAAGVIAASWPLFTPAIEWKASVAVRILLARALSDLSGSLMVAPVVLGALGLIPFLGEHHRSRSIITGCLAVIATAGVFWIIPRDSGAALALVCIPIPLVVIASYRCSLPVLGLVLGLIATLILALTKAGHGPLVLLAASTSSQVLGTQAYLTILSLTGLLLGGVVHQSREVSHKLAMSEGRFREFISGATEGVWRTDICPPVPTCLPPSVLARVCLERSVYTECNDAMARMYGLERAKDLIGMPVLRLMSIDNPQNVAAIRAWIDNGFTVKETETHETDINGNTRYFMNSIVGTVTNGYLTHAWGVQRDVTLKHLAEQAMERSRKRLEAIISNTPHVAVQGYDAQGRVRFWNNASEQMFGYSQQETLGREVGELILNASETREFLSLAKEVLRTGRAIGPYQWEFRRKDGTLGTALSTIFSVPGAEPPEIVCMDIDITARVEAERERGRLEEHLRHAQRHESLGMLAGGLAHDINNLLVGILGNTNETLHHLPTNHPAREWIEQAHASAKRIAGITRGLLAATGRDTAVKQPVMLGDLLCRAVHSLRGSMPDGVSLRLEGGPSDTPVLADEPQLLKALSQLVDNAVEASEHRPSEIVVRYGVDHGGADGASTEGGGSKTYIEVVDTGSGIDPKHIDHVFDPFFTTKFAGRGMGLAVVRGVMKSHGGTASVAPQDGRGTVMRLTFPFTAGEIADSGQGIGNEGPSSNEHSSMEHNGRTILIVDDEPMVRDVTSRLLHHRGYKTAQAMSGDAALGLLEKSADAYSLIILDMTMPGMDGVQTLREIRRRFGDIPVVLSSGYPPEAVGDICRDLGRVCFVQKPFDSKTLVEAIETAIADSARA